MKRVKAISLFVFIFSFFLFNEVVRSQEVSISAGPHEFYLGDSLEVDLKLENLSTIPKIEIPKINNLVFNVSDRASSFSYTSIINGKFSQSKGISIKILVQAKKTGTYYVPGIFAYNSNNQRKQTKSFVINVLEPDKTKYMLTEVIPNKKVYYKGEKVRLDLKWYIKKAIEDYKLFFPLLDERDFYHLKSNPPPPNYSRRNFQFGPLQNVPFYNFSGEKDGERYTIFATSFSLFIEQVGSWEVPVFSAKGKTADGYSNRRDFFGRRLPKYKNLFSNSQNQEIIILDLPAKPANFSGAVGDFTIQTQADANQLKVGEPIKLLITIKGDGNFYNIKDLVPNEWANNFEVYFQEEKNILKDKLAQFSYILRPLSTQVTEIPSIDFSYFNPKKEEYFNVKSRAIPLQVNEAVVLKKEDIISYSQENTAQKEKPIKASFNLNFITPSNNWLGYYAILIGGLLPPAIFFSLQGSVILRRRSSIIKQKQYLAKKYTLANKSAEFSQTLKNYVMRALVSLDLKNKNFATFTQEDLKNKGMKNQDIELILNFRALYNEIIFGNKKLLPEEEKDLLEKMQKTQNVL